ncbi:MAG: agmatine deiminase family protein [Proteobacteria bacterium]|nr:agmatine deiminase family protein [Pseudomonadota bacterium]
MRYAHAFLLIAGICVGCTALQSPKHDSWTNIPGKPLIVLSAPSIHDDYYAEVFDDIIAYDITFANSVAGKDNILILADEDTMPYFQGQVPEDVLLQAEVYDIWIRDFSPLFPANPAKFVYAPNYLEEQISQEIDDSFRAFTQSVGLSYPTNDLVIDGGNFVHNGADKAVFTERVFSDNPGMSSQEIEAALKAALGLSEIAFIPEEAGDTTGHSDGMVMWVSEEKLLVNEYDEPFRTRVLTALETAFSSVSIVEIPSDYELEIWKDFVSACGIYVNALTTPEYIYMPVFGGERDDEIVSLIADQTDKEIITVNASQVCYMGGSVRCLSWQVWGEDADKLVQLARK